MRLIDANVVDIEYRGGFHYDYVVNYNSFINAPTIDAVSVVRCEECKYELICSHSVQHTTYEPLSVTIGYKSVNFCSYGERRKP